MRRRTVFAAMVPLAATTVIPVFATQPKPISSFDIEREWGFVPATPLSRGETVSPQGSLPARNEEVAHGFHILFGAPRNVSPLGVAQYFLDVADRNKDGWLYRAEWPRAGRANPVIVGFLSSTNCLPSEGDETFWCAAFMNFCLAAAGKPLTLSPLSGSFREPWSGGYGQETKTPSQGDIVVFSDRGPGGALGHGHVAFFLSRTRSSITVLGGNQSGIAGAQGAVTKQTISISDGSRLALHSFRSIT